jgi:hypothetical protein
MIYIIRKTTEEVFSVVNRYQSFAYKIIDSISMMMDFSYLTGWVMFILNSSNFPLTDADNIINDLSFSKGAGI